MWHIFQQRMHYIFLLIFVVVTGAIYRSLSALQRHTMWRGPQLPPFDEPEKLPPTVKYTRLHSVIGTSHIAMYSPREPKKFVPWIIFSHGVMHHCEQMLYMFQRFETMANFVMWDYRGFGRSTGKSDRLICNYDLYAVLRHIRHEYEPEHVTLMGSSLGANVTLNFLDAFGERCEYVNQVILCHPLLSLEEVFSHIGAPATLAYVLGRMDVKHVLPRWLQDNTDRRALVLGSSEDSITPWRGGTLWEEDARLKCTDIGGTHFSFNDLLFSEIYMWLRMSD